MQTITDRKTLALIKRDDVVQLLDEAKSLWRGIQNRESNFRRTRDEIMIGGWLLGSRLCELKEKIGHGTWEKWLPANFPELGESEATRLTYAKRCMKLFRDNQNPVLIKLALQPATEIEIDRQKLFSRDSERKFMWRYIPEKERPTTKDPKFPRSVTFLNIVNEFNRLKHRHVNDLQAVDFAEAREETVELLQFLKWLHGESLVNPWASSSRSAAV